jgi:hypothetical protein
MSPEAPARSRPYATYLLVFVVTALGAFAAGRFSRDEPEQPPSLPPEEMHALADQEVAAEIALLEEHIASEPADAAWAQDVRGALDTFVADPSFEGRRPTLAEVRCSTSLCTVRFTHASPESQRALVESYSFHAPFSDKFCMYVARPDGAETTIYLGRPGVHLPMPETG